MHANRLHRALQKLTEAIVEVEDEVAAMKADHDPLAVHIFVSRRNYRNVHDTKAASAVILPLSSVGNPPANLGFAGLSTNGSD